MKQLFFRTNNKRIFLQLYIIIEEWGTKNYSLSLTMWKTIYSAGGTFRERCAAKRQSTSKKLTNANFPHEETMVSLLQPGKE